MSNSTDQQLLRAWATEASEDAFRSLVARYTGLVYGAALRRVGESGLAREITQDVFATLAHRAGKLDGYASLAGWLHRTTMLLAMDRLRRRQRQERKLERLRAMSPAPAPHDPWQAAAPHLDAALDRLRDADREVLMLHYAEGLTFPEIAARLGKTSEAVRMRATRALEALSKLLRGKGVAASVTMLAAGLGGALTQAAPAAALTVAPLAMAGAVKVSPGTFFLQTMKLTQLAAAALALALAVTAVLQQIEMARAETRIAELAQNATTGSPAGPEAGASAPGSSKPGAAAWQKTLAGFDLVQMSRAAMDQDIVALRRLKNAVAALDDNNLAGLLETVLQSTLLPEPREKLAAYLLEEMGTRSVELHLHWALAVMDRVKGRECFCDAGRGVVASLKAWLEKDPEAAAQWALAQQNQWEELLRRVPWDERIDTGRSVSFPPKPGQTRPSVDGETLSRLVATRLLSIDPQRAFPILQKQSPDLVAGAIEANRNLTAAHLQQIAEWSAGNEDAEWRRTMLKTVGSRLASLGGGENPGGLGAVSTMLRALPLSDSERGWLGVRIGLATYASWRPAPEAVDKIAQWLPTFLPPAELATAQGALANSYPATVALQRLGALLDARPDDNLIASYVEEPQQLGYWFPQNPAEQETVGYHAETAFRLATRVQDPDRRQALLARAWASLDRAPAKKRARALLEIPELRAEDRAALETRFAAILQKK